MDAGMKATVLSLAYQMTIKINMLERFLNNVVSYGECKQEPDSEMTRPSPPNTIEEIIATMELNNKRLDELTSRINIEVFDRLDNKTA